MLGGKKHIQGPHPSPNCVLCFPLKPQLPSVAIVQAFGVFYIREAGNDQKELVLLI